MITFKELFKRAETEKIAIHTATEDQVTALLTELEKRGYTWISNEKLTTKTCYEVLKEDTCYVFEIDTDGDSLNKKVMYSPLSFYQAHGFTIIECSDIDFKENK